MGRLFLLKKGISDTKFGRDYVTGAGMGCAGDDL
jgi:hypothetical protein